MVPAKNRLISAFFNFWVLSVRPITLNYASVVLRDKVSITLTIVALHGLDILSCEI